MRLVAILAVSLCALVLVSISNAEFPMTEAQGSLKMPKEFDYFYFRDKVKPAVGEPAISMHAKDPDGKEMDLKQFMGSWVFIEFGSYT